MKLLFIHHSTGDNLIHKGSLRKLLYAKTKTIEFWDHGYNLYTWLPMPILKIVANTFTFHTGLSDSEENITGVDYDINITNDPYAFEKIFIPFTPPPMRKELTKKEYAQRAKIFAQWLTSEKYSQKRKNIHVFDFFNLLADDNGYLKKEYCSLLPIDSHPNKKANMISAPVFVDFITARIHT